MCVVKFHVCVRCIEILSDAHQVIFLSKALLGYSIQLSRFRYIHDHYRHYRVKRVSDCYRYRVLSELSECCVILIVFEWNVTVEC